MRESECSEIRVKSLYLSLSLIHHLEVKAANPSSLAMKPPISKAKLRLLIANRKMEPSRVERGVRGPKLCLSSGKMNPSRPERGVSGPRSCLSSRKTDSNRLERGERSPKSCLSSASSPSANTCSMSDIIELS